MGRLALVYLWAFFTHLELRIQSSDVVSSRRRDFPYFGRFPPNNLDQRLILDLYCLTSCSSPCILFKEIKPESSQNIPSFDLFLFAQCNET